MTSTGASASALAAVRPPNPPPTITTRGLWGALEVSIMLSSSGDDAKILPAGPPKKKCRLSIGLMPNAYRHTGNCASNIATCVRVDAVSAAVIPGDVVLPLMGSPGVGLRQAGAAIPCSDSRSDF
jgi:hypothetical protein